MINSSTRLMLTLALFSVCIQYSCVDKSGTPYPVFASVSRESNCDYILRIKNIGEADYYVPFGGDGKYVQFHYAIVDSGILKHVTNKDYGLFDCSKISPLEYEEFQLCDFMKDYPNEFPEYSIALERGAKGLYVPIMNKCSHTYDKEYAIYVDINTRLVSIYEYVNFERYELRKRF